jgi:hypothetical protein
MPETAVAGEWIQVWLSPVAQFLFDVALAAELLFVVDRIFRLIERRRQKKA